MLNGKKVSKKEYIATLEEELKVFKMEVDELNNLNNFIGMFIKEKVYPFFPQLTKEKYKEMFLGLCKDKIYSLNKFKEFWETFTKKFDETP